MSVVPPAPGADERAMAHLGALIARALIDRDPGDSDGSTGWRGLLQDASKLSRQAPGVLLIADELYRAAHDLTTPAGVRGYAMSTLPVVPDGPGSWLLAGMLEHTRAINEPGR